MDEKEEQTRSLHETIVGEVRKAIQSSLGDVSWDVCGSWAISFPSIENTLNRLDYRCSLDIRFTQGSRREGRLWAKFNFTTIKDVFWLRKENPDSDYDDFHDECSYESFDQDDPNQHCHDHVEWSFWWRGEETSNGKVLHSQQNPGRIEFSGVDGTNLTGILSFRDKREGIHFTGWKTRPSPPFPSIEYQILEFEWDKVGHK